MKNFNKSAVAGVALALLASSAMASTADATGTPSAGFQPTVDLILGILNGTGGLLLSLLAFGFGLFRVVTNFAMAPVVGAFGFGIAIQIIPNLLAGMFTATTMGLPL